MWFVYILKCEDGSLYTGSTNDPDKRFAAHKNGKGAKYTKSHPVESLVYAEERASRGAAQSREAEIKRLSRAEKLELIAMSV